MGRFRAAGVYGALVLAVTRAGRSAPPRRPRPRSRRAQGPPCASGQPPGPLLQPGGRARGRATRPVLAHAQMDHYYSISTHLPRDWRGPSSSRRTRPAKLRDQLVVRLRGDKMGHLPSPVVGITDKIFVPQPETLVRVRRVRVPPLRVPSKPRTVGGCLGRHRWRGAARGAPPRGDAIDARTIYASPMSKGHPEFLGCQAW